MPPHVWTGTATTTSVRLTMYYFTEACSPASPLSLPFRRSSTTSSPPVITVCDRRRAPPRGHPVRNPGLELTNEPELSFRKWSFSQSESRARPGAHALAAQRALPGDAAQPGGGAGSGGVRRVGRCLTSGPVQLCWTLWCVRRCEHHAYQFF